MTEAAFVGLLILFPLIGVAARSWSVVLLPVIGWPVFYAGLNQGWWGNGTGDAWEYAAFGVSVVGVVSTGLAVAVARASRWTRLPQ
jgi:hypothetical protein